ncbi:MAG: Nuclear protein SET [Candidatus Magasanikbacteria bacterium GW2011_GWD2_43_18]|nr:MAG: Nuclear protein SET [Candidatus Magasanikbacteria bacterium GW2011_GWD2_43_18]
MLIAIFSMKKYRIDTSGIQGRGIFLTRDIKKDETIFIFSGKEITFTSGYWWYHPNALQCGYAKWIVPRKGSAGEYLNHCCSPTAGVKGKNRIVAMRDLKKGEEVTIDYALSETYPLWHMTCVCKAKNCRKVVKPAWRMKKYIDYTSKYILDMKMHLNWNEYLTVTKEKKVRTTIK